MIQYVSCYTSNKNMNYKELKSGNIISSKEWYQNNQNIIVVCIHHNILLNDLFLFNKKEESV